MKPAKQLYKENEELTAPVVVTPPKAANID